MRPGPADAAATMAMAASNSSGSVSAPITTLTQVVAPEARASARNVAWVAGATVSPSTLAQLQVHADVGHRRGRAAAAAARSVPLVSSMTGQPACGQRAPTRRSTRGALQQRLAAGQADRVVGDLVPQGADRLDHPVDGRADWPRRVQSRRPAVRSIRHGPGRRSRASGWSQ